MVITRYDNAPVKRVELHLHTVMSRVDALTKIDDLVNTAVAWDMPAVAITDHGVVQAFPKVAHAIKAMREQAKNSSPEVYEKLKNLKIIYGMEGFMCDDADAEQIRQTYEANCVDDQDEWTDIRQKKKITPFNLSSGFKSRHISLLCKNEIGRTNLYRLVSESHLHYVYKNRPHIPKGLLAKYREGLIFGSACSAGELSSALFAGKNDREIEEIAAFYDYFEIQPLCVNAYLLASEKYPLIESLEDIKNINRRIVALGEKLGKLVVATGDVHFLNPEDGICRAMLTSTYTHKLDDHKLYDYKYPLFLRTTDEMLAEFEYLGADKAYEVVVTNTRTIAEQIEQITPLPSKRRIPVISNADTTLRTICEKNARARYGSPLPKPVSDRLEHELQIITANGSASMYIISHKLVKKSNGDGYMVTARGSINSSLAAEMAGITEVNPLAAHYYCPCCQYSEFDFERVREYACRNEGDTPDIDCPICGKPLQSTGHGIPFEPFLGLNGDKKPHIDLVFSGEYQTKAFAYTSKLFGEDYVFRAGTICTIEEDDAMKVVRYYFENKEIVKDSENFERLVENIEGVKRTSGKHPSGIFVLPVGEDIHTFTPVQHPANKNTNTIVTHFDFHDIEEHLLKIDESGDDNLTILHYLVEATGVNVKTIPMKSLSDMLRSFDTSSKTRQIADTMTMLRIAYFKENYPLEYYSACFTLRIKAFDCGMICLGKDVLQRHMDEYMVRQESPDWTQRLTDWEKQCYENMKHALEMYSRGYEFLPISTYRSDAMKFKVEGGKLRPALRPPLRVHPESIEIKGRHYSTRMECLYLPADILDNLDIAPLKYMVNLTELELSRFSQINDISPLAGLMGLKRLTLTHTGVSDISPLARLTKLEALDLSHNKISDISPLAGLPHLTCLDVSGNPIKNIFVAREQSILSRHDGIIEHPIPSAIKNLLEKEDEDM